jgi:hypothetical protein
MRRFSAMKNPFYPFARFDNHRHIGNINGNCLTATSAVGPSSARATLHWKRRIDDCRLRATIVSITNFDGHVYTMEAEIDVLPEAVPPTRRRRHSKEFKAQAIRAVMQPNISIAAVALHYRSRSEIFKLVDA